MKPNKRTTQPDCFSLHQKKPGSPYQACFCQSGQTRWVSTGECTIRQARLKAREIQDRMLRELTLQAARGAAASAIQSGKPTSKPAFTLHQKRPGAAYQARFYYQGWTKRLGTGTALLAEAKRKCVAWEPKLMAELSERASLRIL